MQEPEPRARSIAAWCRLRGISRASFYVWKREHPEWLPQTISMGRRVLITDEADAAWLARRMVATIKEEQKKAAARQTDHLEEHKSPCTT
jgi:predicted DNA-binding transcriptional regulator AlpA